MNPSVNAVAQNDKMTSQNILRRLAALPPEPLSELAKSDRDLNPDWVMPDLLHPAAVLVPLVLRDHGVYVLLTLRQAHLSHHAGQVSFPGGRIDDGDPHPAAAALREAQEEVGLSPDLVQNLGWLDPYVTFTGFHILPLVGLVTPPPRWSPNDSEVAEILEVPLEFFLSPDHVRIDSQKVPTGYVRQTYIFQYGERVIFGATAAMLVNLAEVLRDEA